MSWAVTPALQRHGAGRALAEAAASHPRSQGARFLTVKTLSARDPDPGYVRPRAFYAGMGFLAIKEFPALWNAENRAVMMLKVLA